MHWGLWRVVELLDTGFDRPFLHSRHLLAVLVWGRLHSARPSRAGAPGCKSPKKCSSGCHSPEVPWLFREHQPWPHVYQSTTGLPGSDRAADHLGTCGSSFGWTALPLCSDAAVRDREFPRTGLRKLASCFVTWQRWPGTMPPASQLAVASGECGTESPVGRVLSPDACCWCWDGTQNSHAALDKHAAMVILLQGHDMWCRYRCTLAEQ